MGDGVRVYRMMDKDGKEYYRIEVIKRRDPPLVRNHDAEEPWALAVASYGDVEEEAYGVGGEFLMNAWVESIWLWIEYRNKD